MVTEGGSVKAVNVEATLQSAPQWCQGGASFWLLDPFNGGNAWVGRYHGESPWEMHPDGEELIAVLEGSVDFVLESEAGPRTVTMASGDVLVIPRGIWHRQLCHGPVKTLGATSGRTEHRAIQGETL